MDPITAFSLACGVLQLLEVGCKLAVGAKEIYQKGSLTENRDIREQISHLDRLRNEVMSSRTGRSIGDPSQPQQGDDLLDIAEKSDHAAERLHAELDKLMLSTSRNPLKALAKSAKARYRASTIENLLKEMEKYQSILDTRILLCLRQDIREAALEQNQAFVTMNESMRRIALEFCSGQITSAGQLVGTIEIESAMTRKSIIQVLEMQSKKWDEDRGRQQQENAQANLKREFLDSLLFPDILSREDTIKPAHEETFQWIFDDSGHRMGMWDNFSEWLKAGTDTYWINGKAGSGKSTLMNFIYQDSRTRKNLLQWAGSKMLLTPRFYFWAAGSDLQKSVEGFLRFVIYQVLEEQQHLIPKVSQRLKDTTGFDKSLIRWTEARLLQCIRILIEELSETCFICLFADGLDEMSGDYYELAEHINILVQYPNFKCCFSSRPEKEFVIEFKESKMLRLQDLTRTDIQKYVKSKLGEFGPVQKFPKFIEEETLQELRNIIVEKAEGVFLWVELAVRSQINGIKYDDPVDLLKRKLLALPVEVRGLYCQMLSRTEEDYRAETAWYVEMMLFFLNLRKFDYAYIPVLDAALARYGFDEQSRLNRELDHQTISSRCEHVHRRILVTCEGLIEVMDVAVLDLGDQIRIGFDAPLDKWLAWEPEHRRISSNKTDWVSHKLQFYHRTAMDFFQKDSEGKAFLENYRTFPENPYSLPTAMALARIDLCNLEDPRPYLYHHVKELMRFASTEDSDKKQLSASCATILDQFDAQIQTRYRDRIGTSPGAHWCEYLFSSTLGPQFHNEVDRDLDKSPKERLVDDFLSLAALHNVFWYVHQTLKVTALDSRRATNLAWCILASHHRPYHWSPDNVYTWSISRWDAVRCLVRLLDFQIDPNDGSPTSIWNIVLQYLYKGLTESSLFFVFFERDITQNHVQVADKFIRAGADPHQIIVWGFDFAFGSIKNLHCFVEFDSALFALAPSQLEISLNNENALSTTAQSAVDGVKCRPRIWFDMRRDSSPYSWPKERHVMTEEEFKTFHPLFRAVLDCRERGNHRPADQLRGWLKDCALQLCEEHLLNISNDSIAAAAATEEEKAIFQEFMKVSVDPTSEFRAFITYM